MSKVEPCYIEIENRVLDTDRTIWRVIASVFELRGHRVRYVDNMRSTWNLGAYIHVLLDQTSSDAQESPVKIGLDYDGTYTADPAAWNVVIPLMKMMGYEVYIVTARYEGEGDGIGEGGKYFSQLEAPQGCTVYYTGRKAKRPYMVARGIAINIWIDDMPEFIANDHGALLKW